MEHRSFPAEFNQNPTVTLSPAKLSSLDDVAGVLNGSTPTEVVPEQTIGKSAKRRAVISADVTGALPLGFVFGAVSEDLRQEMGELIGVFLKG